MKEDENLIKQLLDKQEEQEYVIKQLQEQQEAYKKEIAELRAISDKTTEEYISLQNSHNDLNFLVEKTKKKNIGCFCSCANNCIYRYFNYNIKI